MSAPLLVLDRLSVSAGSHRIVDEVSLEVRAGCTLALVGESGSGKSLTSLAIIRLLGDGLRISGGRVLFEGRPIEAISEREMATLRGGSIGMIFQEPVASLDPLMSVGRQIAEALILAGTSRAEAIERAVGMLDAVGIVDPALRATQYPFELSGGMCQRIMIAMAMIRNPRLLLADEPTTALDVTIQKQILGLMRRMQAELGTAIVLVTHDMGVVAESTDEVAVMYAGRIVEQGPTAQVLAAPAHPYTRLLLATTPRIGGPRKVPLPVIEGAVPEVRSWGEPCRFAPRCPAATDICRSTRPPLVPAGQGRTVACHHPRTGDTA